MDTIDITQMLLEHKNGSKEAFDKLFPVVYDQLHKIANRERQKLWNANTINATALVHEAYVKLIRSNQLNAENRAHFFALCALGMRQIIVNYLAQKTAQKRGGDWQKISLSDAQIEGRNNLDMILTVDKALNKLKSIDEKLTDLVQMRFFAGMTEEEIALATQCTERTVRRNWTKAKVLLQKIIEGDCQQPELVEDGDR